MKIRVFHIVGSKGLSLPGFGIAVLAIALFVIGCAQPTATPTTGPAATTPAVAAPTATTAPVSTPAAPTPTPRPEKVSVMMDWMFASYHVPVLVAKDKGWYAENGLDVEVKEGQGSGSVVQLVGSKQITFGYAGGSTIIRAIAEQAVPVKVIAGHLMKSPMGATFLKETGIAKPKDLENRTASVVPGSESDVLFKSFAAVNNISSSTIKWVNVSAATADAAITSGQAEWYAGGFLGAEAYRYTKATGKPADTLFFADYGVVMMGHSFFTHNDTIKEKPDVVRRFLAATVKGIEWTKNNPEEAAKLPAKFQSGQAGTEDYQLMLVKNANASLSTKNTQGKPTGWMSQLDWADSIDTLAKYGDLKKRPDVNDVFTNDFLPK